MTTYWNVTWIQDGITHKRILTLGDKANKEDVVEALRRQNDVRKAEIVNIEKRMRA